MGRGIFSGVIWGSVVAVMALWVASQLGDVINVFRAPPANVEAATPEAAVVDEVETAQTPVAPTIESAPATDPSRQSVSLDAGAAGTPPNAANVPASLPDTGQSSEVLIDPGTDAAPAVVGTVADTDLPDNDTTALAIPSTDIMPKAVAKPAAAAVEAPVEVEQNTPDVPQDSSGTRPAPDHAPATASDPGQPVAPVVAPEPVVDFTKPQIVEAPLPVEPEPAPVAEVAPEQPAAVEAATTPQPVPDLPEATAAPKVARAADAPVKQQVAAIGNIAGNVRTNQLPTIGGDVAEAPEAAPETAEIDGDGPAIERFASEFENPENRPLMAILLLVDPDAPLGDAPTLPFPVSYVVDASRENAGDDMRRYRSAGYEVVALAPLPDQANPADVEVAFQSYLSAMPQVVAVMDSKAAAFQSGRQVATQVAEVLAASGHGMITYSRGMNSAMQVAEREGVPSAVVFREFDKGGQNAGAIKRFLDQAAFRAGQQTGVILVGQNSPETIAALMEWGLGNRASTVALAPVSAVLLAQ